MAPPAGPRAIPPLPPERDVSPIGTFLDAAHVLLPLAYLLAAVAYGFLFFADVPLAHRLATPLLATAVGLHLASLIAAAVRWRQLPLTSVAQALSVIALAVAVVYLFVERHGGERSTGFTLVTLAFALQLLASLLHRPGPPPAPPLASPLFAGHVALALAAYAAFAVAAGYGFLFLRLYRELKGGGFSTYFGRLPPLEVLDRMTTGSIAVGAAALAAALLLGALWARGVAPGGWLADPKTLATLGILALYALTLLLRRLGRWHGRQTAVASLVGLAAVLFSLLTVNSAFTGFHGLR